VEQWVWMTDCSQFILIMAAVADEVVPVTSLFSDKHTFQIGNKPAFSGYIANQRLIVLQSGIGMINAAHATTAAIEKYPIKMIINTGISGAFRESGLSIGDIGIATSENDIHSGIETLSPDSPLKPFPFPLIQTNNEDFFAQYPTSQYHTNNAFKQLRQSFQSSTIIKKVPFITVSTLPTRQERIKSLYKHYNAGMENMEGAAIAHVAIQYQIPFIEVRTASNFVGDRDKSNWKLHEAFEKSARAVHFLMQEKCIGL